MVVKIKIKHLVSFFWRHTVRDKIRCICHSQRLEIDIFVAGVLKLTFVQPCMLHVQTVALSGNVKVGFK